MVTYPLDVSFSRSLNMIERKNTSRRHLFEGQFYSLTHLACIRTKGGKIQEAISYFRSGIDKCEEIRGFLRDNDQFKISSCERNILSYRDLILLLCQIGNPTEALYVSELSRARALADLMSAQYSLENKIFHNPRAWASLQGIVAKECNRTCLYVSYCRWHIYLWTLEAGRVVNFQQIKGNDLISREGLNQHLDEFFNFRASPFYQRRFAKTDLYTVFNHNPTHARKTTMKICD